MEHELIQKDFMRINRKLYFVSLFFICHLLSSKRLFAQLVPDTAENIENKVFIKRGAYQDTTYTNVATGELTPGRGFDMVKTKYGSLNISLYAIARYLNQLPGYQTWYDHLERPRDFVGRNDFFWHRAMI